MSTETNNTITSKEVCRLLRVSTLRTFNSTESFPKPFMESGELLFNKDEIIKYFGVEDLDE